MAPHDAYTPVPIQKALPTPVPTPTQSIKNGATDYFSSASGLRSATESSAQTVLNYLKKWRQDIANWLKERWGWVVTLSTFVLFLVTYGFFACYGLLFVSFVEEFDSGATETGWVGSLASAVAHFAGPLTNYLVQKLHSPRCVIFIGVVTCFIGLMASSLVPNIYYLFGTIGIVCGLGLNMLSQTTLVLIVQYFHDRNSTRSVSIACTGLTIGMLTLSPLVNYALENIGWRATLRYAGIGVLAIGSLCSLPMLPVRHKTRNMQRHLNMSRSRCSLLKEDVQDPTKPVEETSGSLKSELEEKRSVEDVRSNLDAVSLTKPQRSILRRGKMWLLCGCMFFTAVAQTFFNINYVDHLKVRGISGDQSAIMVTLYAAGQIAGELLLSMFAEKLPCQKLYIIGIASLICGLATIPVIFVSSAPLLKAISTVLGFLRAPRTVLVLPVSIEIFGVAHVQQISAVVLVAHGLGFVAGAFVMGVTFDRTGSYVLSIEICISLLITASVIYVCVPVWSRFKKSKHSDDPLNQIQEEETPEECHIVPLSNLVAPVREIVPILVSSQESLNCSPPEVAPDDHWVDYQNNHSPDFIDHSNGVEDIQAMKNIQSALRDDLIVHLIATHDVIIHMPQSSTPVSAIAQRSSNDNFILELSKSASSSHIIESLPSLDDLGRPSYRLKDSDCSKTSTATGTPQSNANDVQSNQAFDPQVSSDYDDDSSISQNRFVTESCGGTPRLIESPLNVCLHNLIGYESNAIAPNDPNAIHGRTNVIENPLSEICDDLIVPRTNVGTPNDCTVSNVMMDDHSTQTVIGQASGLGENTRNYEANQIGQISTALNVQTKQMNSDVLADNISTNLETINECPNTHECISDAFAGECSCNDVNDASTDFTCTSVVTIDQANYIDKVTIDHTNDSNNIFINQHVDSPIIDHSEDFIDPNPSPEALIDLRMDTNEMLYSNHCTNMTDEISQINIDDVSANQTNVFTDQSTVDHSDSIIDQCRNPGALIDLSIHTSEVIYKNHGTNELILL